MHGRRTPSPGNRWGLLPPRSSRASARLRVLGSVCGVVAIVVILVSSQTGRGTTPYGTLLARHPTHVMLGGLALLLFGAALIAGASTESKRGAPLFSGLCLSASAVACCLAGVEWYVRKHPELVLPREIAAIEGSYEEPGVGLRIALGPRQYVWKAPADNVLWTRKDPATADSERHQVTVAIDQYGFPNAGVPAEADIVALGDSFTMGADVEQGRCWVDHLSRLTGWTVWNLGVGGFGVSQEVEVYRRYGTAVPAWGVVVGVCGINDLVDEENYARFKASGMTVKEWAYWQAGQVYPRRSFGFVQLVRKWSLQGRMARFRDVVAPPEDLAPVWTSHRDGPARVSYYPHYQVQAYRVSTLGPSAYAPVTAMVASLRVLAEECRTQGRLLGVLYFPIKQSIHPPSDDQQEEWLAFVRAFVPGAREGNWSHERLAEAGRCALDGDIRLERHLCEVCGSLKIPFHSVRPDLAEAVARSGDLMYYRFDTHWNAEAHRVAGVSVAQWLHGLTGLSGHPSRATDARVLSTTGE